MSVHLNIKITDSQASYLENLAVKQRFLKSDGSPSLGKALKHCLDKLVNNEETLATTAIDLAQTNRLLEQIHAVVPQLFFKAVFSADVAAKNLDDSSFEKLRQKAITQTVTVCGQMQDQEYQHLYLGKDSKNMTTMPIEENKNRWK